MLIYIACGIVAIVAFYLYFKKKTRYGVNNLDGVINYPIVGSIPAIPTEKCLLTSFFIGEGEKRNYKVFFFSKKIKFRYLYLFVCGNDFHRISLF